MIISMTALPLLVIPAMLTVESPQVKDRLTYGSHKFSIQEMPMLSYWDYGPDAVGTGTVKPPEMDFDGFNNWVGYEASWSIHSSKLYLNTITAKRDQKRVKNDQLIPGKRFPLLAKWYTGRVHLFIGEYDFDKNHYESVVICHVENGIVKKITFDPFLKYVHQWNGMPRTERIKQ